MKYGIIEPYIHEVDITSIKMIGPDKIMARKNETKIDLPITFNDEKTYVEYVFNLLQRRNLTFDTFPLLKFIDDSFDDCRLIIAVTSPFITDSKLPYVHIRKIPK